jgi:hypothetical protein
MAATVFPAPPPTCRPFLGCRVKPWISKDYDVVVSCISLLVGGILIFQVCWLPGAACILAKACGAHMQPDAALVRPS